MEPVSEIINSLLETVGITEVFQEMISFINDNIDDDEKDEEDDKYPETRI